MGIDDEVLEGLGGIEGDWVAEGAGGEIGSPEGIESLEVIESLEGLGGIDGSFEVGLGGTWGSSVDLSESFDGLFGTIGGSIIALSE